MRFFIKFLTLAFFLSTPNLAISQIGIGTQSPDASALMDISSQNQGILTPRMTTLQREAIDNPANGLLVFDTDLNAFQYYNSSLGTWEKMSSEKRNNYVLVKSQADFPMPSGGVITLDAGTYYEINGLITLSSPIDINNAYISGLDSTEDVLSYPGGTIFQGNNGGSIRNVTLTGGRAFNITGSGSSNSIMLLQNCIITNMTISVGGISGIGVYFSSVIQFLNNADGITYSNIGKLLLNNQGWFTNNAGTYETLKGTFNQVEKIGGFSNVEGSAVGFDVSSNPTVKTGVVLSRVFSGSGIYVKGYTSGSYPGYNFTNNWTINCPGLPEESDVRATANLYYSNSNIVVLSNNTPRKLPVTTVSARNFRTTSPESNQVVYKGSKPRSLNIYTSISFTAIAGMRLTFSLYKNGSQVIGTNTVYDVPQTNGRLSLPIIGTVMVDPDDKIEVWVERNTGSGGNEFLVTSYNLLVN